MDTENVAHIYNGILFNLKAREVLPFVTTLMNLGATLLREISQTQNDKYCMIPLT